MDYARYGIIVCPCCGKDIQVSYDDVSGFSARVLVSNAVIQPILDEYNEKIMHSKTMRDLLNAQIQYNKKVEEIFNQEGAKEH